MSQGLAGEVSPELLDVALHYTSSLIEGGFSMVLRHDRVMGYPVEDVRVVATPRAVHRALDELALGRMTVLHARPGVATLRCDGFNEGIDRFAVLEATVAGSRWVVATRVYWSLADFGGGACAEAHARVVVAVTTPRDGRPALYRLAADTLEGMAVHRGLREALLRETVLRPVFERGGISPASWGVLPRSGEVEGGIDG